MNGSTRNIEVLKFFGLLLWVATDYTFYEFLVNLRFCCAHFLLSWGFVVKINHDQMYITFPGGGKYTHLCFVYIIYLKYLLFIFSSALSTPVPTAAPAGLPMNRSTVLVVLDLPAKCAKVSVLFKFLHKFPLIN